MTQGTTKRLPTIGTVIRAWRIFRGFSSTELAEKAGVRIGYLSEIEHDRTLRPYEDYLEKLADALRVPLGDILGRRMPPKRRGRKGLKRATGPTPSLKQPAAPLPTIANPALALPERLVDARVEEVERLIASGRYSKEEEEEVWAAVIEIIKRFNSFKETQHKTRKEG
jgi:transcriptional regulator with XRE-family HTH domain